MYEDFLLAIGLESGDGTMGRRRAMSVSAPAAGHDFWRSGRWLREQLSMAEDVGYFGPSSAIWRIHQEGVLALGLGRALLLQLAHPWVAQAVTDHSTFQHEPVERLMGTVSAAELFVFGSRSHADAVAAHIREIHTRVQGTLSEDVGRWRRGTPYRADDPDALRWVLVTLIDTTLVIYDSCFGRLPDETVAAYASDAARLGSMLGLPPEMVPRDRSSLREYMRAMMSDGTVAVGTIARNVANALMWSRLPPPANTFFLPYRSACRALAATTLPAELRSQFSPVLELRHRYTWQVTGRIGRALLRRAPPTVRLDPIAATAIRRVESGGAV